MLEVLAPVGNIQSLKSAIYAGADAVYLGLDLFNARIKADNFTIDNIAHWVGYCHLFGVKVYVAFNTNIKQNEREVLANYVDASAKAGADAFIVTDLGCLDIFKRYDVPLHGSTQIGVHNLAGAKVLEELGFTRVVLARETLREDIADIRKNTKLEIEYFVHGALCVCFSGACLMSSMMSGDSGNRGRCNQPCRLKYSSSYNNRESYLLSPKDQCLIEKLSDLAEWGVDSLKIEGRLKQPHYVGEVVSQYRKAVDNFLYGKSVKIDYDALKSAYNRGNFTLGYNYQQSKDIMYSQLNNNIGLSVGKIVSTVKDCVTLDLSKELRAGDGVKVIFNGVELGGTSIANIEKAGRYYKVKNFGNYPVGSEICLTLSKKQVDKYKDIAPKLSIKMQFTAKRNKKISLKAIYGNIQVECLGEVAQTSVSQSANYDSVAKQLLRLGESDFKASLDVDLEDNLFVPASQLNALRREVVDKLSKAILMRYDKNRQRIDFSRSGSCYYPRQNAVDRDSFFVEVDADGDKLAALQKLGKKVNMVLNIQDIITKTDLIENNVERIYLKLPRVARYRDYIAIGGWLADNHGKLQGIVADNLYGVYLAKKYSLAAVGGIGLNIYNNESSRVLGLDYYINSIELTYKEAVGGMIYAYGRLPIMTLLHCPIQVNTGCNCNSCRYNGEFSYYDRRGEYIVERLKLSYCQFTLYNQQTVDIRNKLSAIEGNYYLNLRSCNVSQITDIINDFDKKCGKSVDNSTYGHLFRGVK